MGGADDGRAASDGLRQLARQCWWWNRLVNRRRGASLVPSRTHAGREKSSCRRRGRPKKLPTTDRDRAREREMRPSPPTARCAPPTAPAPSRWRRKVLYSIQAGQARALFFSLAQRLLLNHLVQVNKTRLSKMNKLRGGRGRAMLESASQSETSTSIQVGGIRAAASLPACHQVAMRVV